ncbi:unnamed protein product [Rotaria magnacalcarata]
MLIANPIGAVVDAIFASALENIDASHAWVGLLCYTLQIYFDFSGYSDMAIGLAQMFGIRFLENFNYPYASRSIREFWRRWHISLSNWFRDYLYVSLGGNRISKHRLYLNILTVFLLCGLWHGASWNFIIWGLFHGIFLALERTTIFTWVLQRIPRVFEHLYTLTIVSYGWVFFRSPTLEYSIGFTRTLLGLQLRHNHINIPIKRYLDIKVILVTILAILGSSGALSALIRVIKDIPNHYSNRHVRMSANLALTLL